MSALACQPAATANVYLKFSLRRSAWPAASVLLASLLSACAGSEPSKSDDRGGRGQCPFRHQHRPARQRPHRL